MATGLTRAMGEFIAGVSYDQLPGAAVDIVRTGFADCAGVLIAGSREPATDIVRSTTRQDATGEARLCFSSARAAAPDAALINATAAHALDYDDVALNGHPSAVLVPAILAEGEATGATGRDMVTAFVAGYEVWHELARRDADQHHEKGWHPTAIFGVIAAAAASAVLRRLDSGVATMALGLAASAASGIGANFGTMTKPYHAGQAARGGIVATRLAAAGMTAAADAFEHPLGFLSAFSPQGRVDVDSPPALGREWHIIEEGLNIKKYPMCYCVHRAVDGVFDMLSRRPLAADEIDRIEVLIGRTQATVLRNHQPQTGLEAKFSLEFAMTAPVVVGRAGLAELTDAFVRRGDVQAFMKKIAMTTTEERHPADAIFAPYDQVTMTLGTGEVLDSGAIEYALGHARNPIRADQLWDKFYDCVGPAYAKPRAEELFDRLREIESIAAVADLPASDEPVAAARAAS